MALGLTTEAGGGDFTPIVKYDARAGRMFRIDREQGAAGWETNSVEISNGFKAIFDMENIQVGWALFAAGIAPSFALVPLGQPLPAKPSDQHKQGFKILLKLGKDAGGDVRELSSCAKVVINALDSLHTAYEAQKAANPGKLPIVAMTGTKPVVSQGQGQSSTNYMPVFEIVAWADRPAELTGTSTVAPAPAPAPQAAVAPAPAAKALVGAEEF